MANYLAEIVEPLQKDIIKYDLNIRALIQDIRECEGPVEYLDRLNASVKEKLHHLRTRIEELEGIAEEQDKETDRTELLNEVQTHKEQVAGIYQAFRKANIAAQFNVDKANRDILLCGPEDAKDIRKRRDKESLAKSSSNVTDNLLSISHHMSNQVQQSEAALESLVNSSKSLTDTQEEFKAMGSVLQQSGKLLTKYNRREFTDKVLIFLAMAFFFACAFYVVKKRLF